MADERINKILDWLGDRITKVEDFVLEQAPDVVKQIITMDIISSWYIAAWLAVSIVVVIIAWKIVFALTGKFGNELEAERVFLRTLATLACIGAVGGMIAGIAYQSDTIVKATYAPKAYLLQRIGVLK